jgi:hypothetical protein
MRGHEQPPGKADTPEPARRWAAPPSTQTAARIAATGAGPGLSAGMVRALQRIVGNEAVARMLRGPATVQRSSVHRVLGSAGRPLDDPVREEMEARLGTDLSDVRLHTGAEARASAAEVGARAYTSGNHIVVGEGGADRHTLAHELTHVIQQRRGPVAGTDNGQGLRISDPSDRFEREAEANATRILRGPVPAPVAAGAPGGASTVAAGASTVAAGASTVAAGVPSTPGGVSTAAGSPMAVQRTRSKTNWADSVLTEQKRSMVKPTEWGDAAMHHKISKERLVEIAQYLDEAMRNGNKAAKDFNATCLRAVDQAIKKKVAHSTDKLLWNMAVNVSVGPQSPVGDPGMQFDPDTEVNPDVPGERRMDEVSSHLKRVEDLWMAARADEERIADVWGEMNTSMRAAIQAHERVAGSPAALAPLTPSKLEQWVAETTDGRGTRHHRKGLRAFPGEQRGADMFRSTWANARGLEGLAGSDKVAATKSFKKDVGGRPVRLTMTVTDEAIYHICRRHTFEHFDFDDVKAVNNFWPVGTGVEQLRGIVERALLRVVEECFGYYIEKADIATEMYELLDAVELKNLPAGDQTVFVIGSIDDVEEVDEGEAGRGEEEVPEQGPSSAPEKSKGSKLKRLVPKSLKKLGKGKAKGKEKEKVVETSQPTLHYTGTISTLAPDGKSSQTFLSTELQRIRQALLAPANTGDGRDGDG